jgi:rhamnose transport system ATP-binding protein
VPLALGSVPTAQEAGVILIHQEPRLFGDLDVVDNMFVGSLPRGRFGVGVDRRTARRRAQAALDELGCTVGLDEPVRALSVADQQLVDIASALLRNPKVLVVDEPTASLTPVEVQRLFVILRRLRDRGVAIVFIGHRLEEILEISDAITVLRDGQHVADVVTAETDTDTLVRLMVGRARLDVAYGGATRTGDVLLDVQALSSPGAFANVSLSVRAGEIVALAGLVGAGRTEIAEAIFGVRSRSGGEVRVGRDRARVNSAREAVRAGLAYVPEDRATNGLVLTQSLQDNITTPILSRLARWGLRRSRAERTASLEAISRFDVVCRGPEQRAGELSGGNQQKVSLARWLVTEPRVLLVDEPTRGVDVGAKAEIHRMLAELARRGLALLVISSELPEVLALADRVIVVREGRIAGELRRAEASEESIITLATSSGAAA